MANNKIKIDDLISTISDFKSTAKGQMINIHQKEYATVAHRLAVARRNLGLKLSIQTELVSADENTVTMKASVFIDDKLIATGYAEENRKASRINQTSALENAETSACGRALAFCGITNDNIASADEVSAAIEQQDNKIQQCLSDLNSVSHSGSYQQWLTNNKSFLADLKNKNPMSYEKFIIRFTEIKNKLKQKGAIQ